MFSRTIGGRRLVLTGLLAGTVALGVSALAQGYDGPYVSQAPTITGTLRVGQTLTATGGRWNGTATYQWLRCSDRSNVYRCSILRGQNWQTYRLVNEDLNMNLRVAVIVRDHDNHYAYAVSNAVGPVSPAGGAQPTPPPPPPPPAPTPEPTPAATPTPAPDVAAAPVATPVPTSGDVLHQTATSKKAKMIRPKPVVRVRGRLTRNGARVTSLTVKAPRGVKITATCSGRGCPARKYTRKASRLTHLAKFQRVLRAGTRITIRISKPGGYITKVTVLEIRRGRVPLRRDGCQWPARKKLQRCPGD